MARKQRKSKSQSVAVHAVHGTAPARPPDAAVSRVLKIPAQVLEAVAQGGPLEGVPDVTATRLLLGGLVALFALIALSLGAAVLLQDDGSNLHGNEAIVALAILALFAGLGGGLWYLLRQLANAGQGSIRIDAEGMRWGDPALPQAVAWNEVCRTRSGLHDVRTEFVSSDAIVKRLVFHRTVGASKDAEIRLPLALTTDAGRVVRFRNRAVLLRALLLRLATQPRPRLRFAAELFIDAGIDPETWEPMLAPRRWMWFSSLAALLPALAVIILWPVGEHVGWMVAALILAMVMGAGAMGWFMHQRYPGLQGVFEFETPSGSSP
jgi:hypothetical protein